MARMNEYIVKYTIKYKSGKNWNTIRKVFGITKQGAIDVINWLHKNKNVSIISINETGNISKESHYGNNHTVGER
jgi:hypothetical protein